MEATFSFSQANLPSQATSNEITRPTLANIQSSYSTNDIPTIKSTNGLGGIVTPTKTQAQQHFHNHNASLGRIPLHAVNNRQSRELPAPEVRREEPSNGYQPFPSVLQASAAPFGPSTPAALATDLTPNGVIQMNSGLQYATPAFYGGYGMQLANMNMTPIQMGNAMAFNNQMQTFQTQNAFPQFQSFPQPPRFADSQARVIQQRRLQNGEGLLARSRQSLTTNTATDNARFINVKLEHLQGEIYGLCKDQHGCRYLQKKLEERNPEYVHIIFLETNQHVVELMTGMCVHCIYLQLSNL